MTLLGLLGTPWWVKLTCQSCLDAADEKSFPGCFQRGKAGERDVFPLEQRYGSLFPRGQMRLAAKCTCRDAQKRLSIPQVLSRAGAARAPEAHAQGTEVQLRAQQHSPAQHCTGLTPKAWSHQSMAVSEYLSWARRTSCGNPQKQGTFEFLYVWSYSHTERLWTLITVSFATL